MRKTLSLFTIVFFVFGIFVYGKSNSNLTLDFAGDKDGMVLGISEDTSVHGADNNIEKENNNLPPVKKSEKLGLEMTSEKAVVLDCKSNSVMYENNSTEKVEIASITKLATALVFLTNNTNLDDLYEVKKEDRVEGGLLHLRVGDLVTIKDLLNLSLISSDNMATMALVGASGLTLNDFIAEMNIFAKVNGLIDTNFVDTIGLGQNISTASDVAKLANLAFANEIIANIVAQEKYIFSIKDGREVTAKSTNILLNKKNNDGIMAIGGKTGFTNSAGYCFVGKFTDENNKNIISVVLNDGENNSRFYQARNLAKWAFDNFSWNN